MPNNSQSDTLSFNYFRQAKSGLFTCTALIRELIWYFDELNVILRLEFPSIRITGALRNEL